MSLLVGNAIAKRYKEQQVVDNVQINISKGSAVGIAGSTGSGKSTLLKILAGLLEPDEGTVHYRGEKVEGPATKLIAGHAKISYLSQHFELRNNYRVEEIFSYPNQLENSQAEELFVSCEIDHLLKRRTDELSGGEKQRIALARVLLTKPEILLLDEPFSNLDLIQKTSLKQVLATLAKTYELTIVLVSHDPVDLLSFAETIYVMRDGRIVRRGTATEIYYHPNDDYVAGLFGLYSFINQATANLLMRNLVSTEHQTLFIRPEMLMIVQKDAGRINGIVEGTWFTGPVWQAKVLTNGCLLIINHNNPFLCKGRIVGIVSVDNP